MMTRVVIYVRVSTQEQAKEGYSIKEQIERLEKYCDAMGWVIVKIYTDAGQSGASMGRPALQDMIRDIEDGKADKVVVYKLDRLSRSQKDTLLLIEDIFLANDCDFVSMQENFDTSTPFGRAMIGILAVFAQLEREQIKERLTMGREARAKEGKYAGGGHKPTGYDYVDGYLNINEFEAMQIRELFDRFNNNESFNIISEAFKEKGYAVNDPRNLRYILTNKLYCGYLRYQGGWTKGVHEPIVDEGTFALANKILEARQKRGKETGHSASNTTHLGGFIFCKHCGARYSKHRSGSKKYGYREIYACYSRHKRVPKMVKDPNCRNDFHLIDELDNLIFSEIKKLKLEPDYIGKLKQQNNSEDAKKIKLIEKEIASLDGQVSRFMDLYGIGRYTVEQLDAKTLPLNEQRDKLQKTLSKLKNDAEKLTKQEVEEFVDSLEKALENGNLQEIRGIIEALISKIEIDNEDITIYWSFV